MSDIKLGRIYKRKGTLDRPILLYPEYMVLTSIDRGDKKEKETDEYTLIDVATGIESNLVIPDYYVNMCYDLLGDE